jgi:hypothetical protein
MKTVYVLEGYVSWPAGVKLPLFSPITVKGSTDPGLAEAEVTLEELFRLPLPPCSTRSPRNEDVSPPRPSAGRSPYRGIPKNEWPALRSAE